MIRLGLVFTVIGTVLPAQAQTTVTLMHDNDEWARTEQEYASGSRLSVINPAWAKADWVSTIAGWLPGAEPGDVTSAGFGAGHYFYIPKSIDATGPIADQRAYAGYLHGSGMLIRENAGRQDTWKLDAGVIGPSARARELEEIFHDIFNGRDMLGWDNQLTDRLAANLSWERRWRNTVPLGAGVALDVSPVVGAEMGSVSVGAGAGLTVRVGAGLEADFGAPRAGAFGGSLMRRGDQGWTGYVFASANARYQAYDVFLDEPGGKSGDPLRGGAGIARDRTLTETSVGFVLANGGARLTFAWNEESERYRQQAEPQHFGEVTLGFSF